MIRYSLEDCVLKSNTKYKNLYINDTNHSSILNIYRIVSGTANVRDNFDNKLYKVRENNIYFPTSINASLKQQILIDGFDESINLDDLDKYFKKAKNNKKFYDSLEIELIKCVIAYKKNNYLESFFYLYRIIEGISYSIPLIYISKKTDYKKTYGSLQFFFGKDKEGELQFFKKFITETFKDEDFYKSDILIDLNSIINEELREKYYNLFLSKINSSNIIDKDENNYIKVKFIGYYDFIIELRNRFFHNLKGTWAENFDSTELLYPDIFFKPIALHGINWFSLILFEIIKFDLEKLK